MKKTATFAGVLFYLFACIQLVSASLNEWTFETDVAGLTLSQATNSGTEQVTFGVGGEDVLETDGAGNLLSTHTGGGTNGVWTSGTILNANIADVTSGVQYLRYDLDYDLSDLGHEGGAVLGFCVVDSSGTHVAGLALTCDWGGSEVPAEYKAVTLRSAMSGTGHVSAILKVNMTTKTVTAWYDLSGSNIFDENSPAVTDEPVSLSSIDQLRFQATGDFRPTGSTDAVAINNLRTASTWGEIAFAISAAPKPNPVPFAVSPVFSGNMVLQRDMDVPIWGHATYGSVITIKLDGMIVGTAVADEDGRWQARIGYHADDGGIAHILSISAPGEATIQFSDVVFGDVYIASGQSNMAHVMSADPIPGYTEEQAAADAYPLIRQMTVQMITSTVEQEDPVLHASWTKCSTATIADFSATGYFFAKNVYLKTGVPVGLLLSAWGGREIERFINPAGLGSVPELSGLQQCQEEGGVTNLYLIYNAMIEPLSPYGVRGVIWYQGEQNVHDGNIYQYKMRALMNGWRQKWGQGDFPFYYVQLPNISSVTANDFPGVRDAQFRALAETNCGMAVTIDVGDGGYHPVNKIDIGYRLAQWTLAKDMDCDIPYSGPLYYSARPEGSQIRILFDYAENGLITAWKAGTNPLVETSGILENFEIAGSNRAFVAADAVIDQDTVIVSNESIAAPVYVRYCYINNPTGTNKLYNTAGFPASPFRTDESYRLDVTNGSALYTELAPGEQSSITANDPSPGKIFDRWIGAASEIDNLNASTATVTMPNHFLYLLATYRDETSPAYTLTVNGGFGSGSSQPGSILNIEAAAPASGQVFDHWAGDTQSVVSVSAPVTTLRMPTNNIAVSAVYRISDHVGDGITDEWRATYFGGDGLTTNSQSAADADPDGDGLSNFAEFTAGTFPTDLQSVFKFEFNVNGGMKELSFRSVLKKRYSLEKAESLTAPVWNPVLYNIYGDGSKKSFYVDGDVQPNEFFRLIVK